MSSLKEQIVREMIDLLQRAPEGRQLDLASLVTYLDENTLGWMYGSTLHTYPLFEYCMPFTGWNADQFQNVLAPLEARLSSHFIQIEFSDPPFSDDDDEGGHTVIQQSPFGGAGAMAAALVTGGFSSFEEDSGFDATTREALINMILKCTSKTEVEDIIDPGKLRGFLEETIDEMKEGDICNLQMLWEILLDAPGITQDMLIPAFLLMEREESPVPLELPSLVQKLPAKIRESLLAQVGVGTASEPEAPESPQANKFMIQRSSEKAPSKPPPSERPSPAARKPPQRAERPERPKKDTARGKKNNKKAPKGKQGPRARIDGGGGFPKWILVVLLVALVGGGVAFFVMNRKPVGAVLEGRVIDVMTYRSVFPASEVRLKNRILHVRVKPIYLNYSPKQRRESAFKLWQKMRQKVPTIHTMKLYRPKGGLIQTFGSR